MYDTASAVLYFTVWHYPKLFAIYNCLGLFHKLALKDLYQYLNLLPIYFLHQIVILI
jgi:hypothetical protein